MNQPKVIGELSKEEFAALLGDAKFVMKMKLLDIETSDLPDIFRICDDGDGCSPDLSFMPKASSNFFRAQTALLLNQIRALVMPCQKACFC